MDEKTAGALLFLGAAQFLICMMVAGALYPGYSISDNYISDLGIGPSAPLFNLSIVALGALSVTAAYLLRGRSGALVPPLMALMGIGAAGVGIFPENVPVLHPLAALVAFGFGALLAIAASASLAAPFRHISLALGFAALAALCLFGLSGAGAEWLLLGIGKGGMERMIAYPELAWAMGFGAYIMNSKEG
jgi:hypothetical membrane protein